VSGSPQRTLLVERSQLLLQQLALCSAHALANGHQGQQQQAQWPAHTAHRAARIGGWSGDLRKCADVHDGRTQRRCAQLLTPMPPLDAACACDCHKIRPSVASAHLNVLHP
jgi:hypothetical protein